MDNDLSERARLIVDAAKAEQPPPGYLERLERIAQESTRKRRPSVRRKLVLVASAAGVGLAAAGVWAIVPAHLRMSPEQRAELRPTPSEAQPATRQEAVSSSLPTASGGNPKPRKPPPTRQKIAPVRAEKKSLSEELGALEEVRIAVAAGRAVESIKKLDEYEREFGSGELAREAAVLRIEALALAGHKEEARSRALEFLEQNPHSALSERAKSFLRSTVELKKGEQKQ